MTSLVLHKVGLKEVEAEVSEVWVWQVFQDVRVISIVVGGHSVRREKCVSHNAAAQ